MAKDIIYNIKRQWTDISGWHILLGLTWMYANLLMRSSIEGHSDFFKILAIMSRAAVHNRIFV